MNRKQKKHEDIRKTVSGLIAAYEGAGAASDPLGAYTGVTREVRDSFPLAHTVSAIPDTKTPADAVTDGKRYVSAASFGAAEPVQDADDL